MMTLILIILGTMTLINTAILCAVIKITKKLLGKNKQNNWTEGFYKVNVKPNRMIEYRR